MQSVHRLFTPVFPTVSYRFMALLSLDVNDIFKNIIVNIKNTAFYIFYFSFAVSLFVSSSCAPFNKKKNTVY